MDEINELKTLVGDVHKSFNELKDSNDLNLKKRDALLEEKIAKINDSIDATQEKMKDIQKDVARSKAVKDVQEKPNAKADLKHLLKYLRKNEHRSLDDAYKTFSTSEQNLEKRYQTNIDSDGGYLMQPEMLGVIAGLVREISPIRTLASVRNTSRDSVEITSYDKGTISGWEGEGEESGKTEGAKFQKTKIEINKLYAEPHATQEQLDDAGFDFEGWIINEITDSFAQTEGTAFVLGDGFKKPKGFLDYESTNLEWEYGKIRQINSGVAGSFDTDSLINLQHSLKTFYKSRGTFIMNRATMGFTRTLKYAGGEGYIWQPSYQAGVPDRLLGNPLVEVPDMPDNGVDALSVAFGDFATTYQIVDRMGLRVIRDDVTAKGTIKFYSTRRLGAGAVQFDALKILKCAV